MKKRVIGNQSFLNLYTAWVYNSTSRFNRCRNCGSRSNLATATGIEYAAELAGDALHWDDSTSDEG